MREEISSGGVPRHSRLAALRPAIADAGLALTAAFPQVLDRLTPADPRFGAAAAVVAAAQCLPLLACRHYPWPCWWAVYAGTQVAAAASFAGVPTTPWTLLPLLIALYQLGADGLTARRRRLVIWSLAAGTAEVAVLNVVTAADAGVPALVVTASVAEDLVAIPCLMAAAWAAGGRLRASRSQMAAMTRARAADARQAVLEERARLARDLHDVAAHHLSSLVTQAEALRSRGLDGDGAIAAVADTGRLAMDEMRALLGVLRAETAAGAPPGTPVAAHSPTPTLRDLPDLVRSAGRDGQDVTVDAGPGADELPAAISMTAYRLIQESLSNARQHSPGAPVRIRVRPDDGRLRITICNDPPPTGLTADTRAPGSRGHGLTGMGERVRLLGGDLVAGPAADRGWQVRALLPLPVAGRAAVHKAMRKGDVTHG